MPFYGYTGIPSPEAPSKTVAGTLLDWKVTDNDYVAAGRAIATVQIGQEAYTLRICFPALILQSDTAADAPRSARTTEF